MDINAKNKDGETALMLASSEGHLEIVKLLIEKGADVNVKNEDGKTALTLASRYGHLEVVKYLVENGADVNSKENDGDTALYYAKTEEIKEVLRKAEEKSANSGKDTLNSKQLVNAVLDGNFEKVQLLLKKGVDINSKDEDGDTALMIASSEGHLEIVKLLLLRKGADVNIKNNDGKTALDLAKTKEIKDLLRKAGAK